MSSGLDHVFLTRFNLPSAGVESLIRAKDGWLRGRVELFERYCLASMQAQSVQDFRWIIYFDPESPEWLKDWIRSPAITGRFSPHFRESVSPDELVDDIRSLVGDPGGALLTTNLDNDDAVAIDFVERLQSVSFTGERSAVYLTRGLIQSSGGLYLRTDRTNAFCSVVESWDRPQTCWSDWHNRLGRHMAVRAIGGEPAWLQVVHGSNVSNRVHGLLTSPSRYSAGFPGLLDQTQPLRGAVVRDRLLAAPARVARDAARSAAKGILLAVGGKSGLDRAKSALGSVRSSTAKERS
jgi:hypothetical protein